MHSVQFYTFQCPIDNLINSRQLDKKLRSNHYPSNHAPAKRFLTFNSQYILHIHISYVRTIVCQFEKHFHRATNGKYLAERTRQKHDGFHFRVFSLPEIIDRNINQHSQMHRQCSKEYSILGNVSWKRPLDARHLIHYPLANVSPSLL